MPSAEMVTPSMAPGDQLAFSAASIAGTRMTPFCDAPVAAARTSPALVLTTNPPVTAKREAGWGGAPAPPFGLPHNPPGEREARGGMGELGIPRLGRNRERHRGNDL